MIFVLWLYLFLILCIFYWYIINIRKSTLMFIFLTVLLIYNIVPPLLIPTGIFRNYTKGLNEIGIIPLHIVYYSLFLTMICITSLFVGFILSKKSPILFLKIPKVKICKLNPKTSIYIILFLIYSINIFLVYTGNTNGILRGGGAKINLSGLYYFFNLTSLWTGVFSLLLLVYELDNKMKKYDSYFFILLSIVFYSLTTNTRYYSIILILGLAYFTYLKEMKKKNYLFKFSKISIIIIIILFIYGYVRSYSVYNISYRNFFTTLNIYTFIEALDFPITYSYYLRTIQDLGKNLPYVYGLSFYKVLFIFIPHFIWPAKPLDPSIIMMKYISPRLYAAGVSAGNGFVGESYMNFGIFGVILFGNIIGFFIGILEKYFSKNAYFTHRVVYIYLIGLLIEINRGALASDIIEFIIICLFPIIIYNYITADVKMYNIL
ncbi:MAG: O-antigen polymerase [Burkholderiales bacterium]